MMKNLSFVVAAFALLASASAKTDPKPKTLRATCTDGNGAVREEGDVWYEGVNGCLKITCTNGEAVGLDSCQCKYPDGTYGTTGDVWWSVPTCTTCSCNVGLLKCDPLLNCIKPIPSASAVAPIFTVTSTQSAAPPIFTLPTAGTTCQIDGNVLNIGDIYIEGCQTCTCTSTGIVCTGMSQCPGVVPPSKPDSCYKGYLGLSSSDFNNGYAYEGESVKVGCKTCVCKNSFWICDITCPGPGVVTETVFPSVVTVTAAPAPVPTIEAPDFTDDLSAAFDCDIGIGIVVNGDKFVNECGADCICIEGVVKCSECPGVVTPAPTSSPSFCVTPDKEKIENGASYMKDDCTTCVCYDGLFTCTKDCDRECKHTDGTMVMNGDSYSSDCQKCKCKDSKLTCSNTCSSSTCKVPNSDVTLKAGQSKNVDDCTWCKCSSSCGLSCTDKCPTTDCVCNGKVVEDGEYYHSSCQKCKCTKGELSCKDTC